MKKNFLLKLQDHEHYHKLFRTVLSCGEVFPGQPGRFPRRNPFTRQSHAQIYSPHPNYIAWKKRLLSKKHM